MVQEPKIGENLDGDSIDPVKTIRRRSRKRIAYLEFFAVCASSRPDRADICEKSLRSGVSVRSKSNRKDNAKPTREKKKVTFRRKSRQQVNLWRYQQPTSRVSGRKGKTKFGKRYHRNANECLKGVAVQAAMVGSRARADSKNRKRTTRNTRRARKRTQVGHKSVAESTRREKVGGKIR